MSRTNERTTRRPSTPTLTTFAVRAHRLTNLSPDSLPPVSSPTSTQAYSYSYSTHIQLIFKQYSSNTQAIFKRYSNNIQSMFKKYSRNTKEVFKDMFKDVQRRSYSYSYSGSDFYSKLYLSNYLRCSNYFILHSRGPHSRSSCNSYHYYYHYSTRS